MNDWEIKKLSDICKVNYGQSPKLTLSAEGNIPVVGTGNEIRYGKNYLYDGESIILGRKGTIDNPIYVSGKFWAIDTAFYLSNFIDADVKWLHFYLLTRKNYFISEATGVPSISRSFLYDIVINTPPKKEQTVIAQILSSVDNTIEQTEKLIAKYQRIKAGLMQDLFTKGIDEHGNIRSEKIHKFKNSPLGRIPIEWEVVELGDYSYVTKLAGFEYTLHFDYSIGGEIIAIRGLNLKNGELELTDIQTIPKATSEYLRRSKLSRGDLVISYVGTVGEMAVIEEDNRFHLAPNVAKISVKKNYINPWFLKEYLFSYTGKIEIINQSASTTQAALTMGNLRKIRITLPPLKEQALIEKKLDDIDYTVVSGKKYLKKLLLLKSGLMQDLLTGKVRVNHLLSKN